MDLCARCDSGSCGCARIFRLAIGLMIGQRLQQAGETMKNGTAALQKALYEALKSDTDLIETLGGERVYDQVPPRTAFPYITLGETLSRDWSTASEAGGEHFLNIQIWAREAGRKRVLDIAGLIA